MKKLVVYGGSFNPPHNGHIHCIREANKALCPDLILLIPSFIAPHKPSSDFASGEDRANMLKLVAEEFDNVQVDCTELLRKGVSYTIDTLRAVKLKYNPEEIILLMGQDMFETLNQWHRYKEIIKTATICVVPRETENNREIQKQLEKFTAMGANVVFLNTHLLNTSSTQIRISIKKSMPIDNFVNKKVAGYILQKQLYQK